jgi:hypothetical protein
MFAFPLRNKHRKDIVLMLRSAPAIRAPFTTSIADLLNKRIGIDMKTGS